MKLTEIEKQLVHEIKESTPNDYERIKTIAQKKIDQKGKKQSSFLGGLINSFRFKVSVAAACSFIILAAIISMFTSAPFDNEVYATIAMDINPSIEIQINKNNDVLSIKGVNIDSGPMLDSISHLDGDLENTFDAIVEYLVENNYMIDSANSLLISIDSKDIGFENALKSNISNDMKNRFNQRGVDISIIAQSYNRENNSVIDLANEHNISRAKAQIISNIRDTDERISLDGIVDLSINDISLLVRSKGIALSNTELAGEASDQAYISKNDLTDIIMDELSIVDSDDIVVSASFSAIGNGLIYLVELEYDDEIHTLKINAMNGNVIQHNNVGKNDVFDLPPSYAINQIKALNKSLKWLGLSHNQVDNVNIQFLFDPPMHIYRVEFTESQSKYNFEINAINSKIISYRTASIGNSDK